ncbi:MAG: sugar phosphate isomerase/epimerase family protein [Haloplanus sp.]
MSSDDVDVLGSYWTLAGEIDPTGDRLWSPWDFKERVETAAEVGFSGFGLLHPDLRRVTERYSFEEMNAIFEANDIEYVELEFLDYWFLESDDERRQESEETKALLFEAAAALDARHVKIGNIPRISRPVSQVEESFAELCAEAADYDTNVAFEFMAEDGVFDTFQDALDMIRRVDASNGGIVLDTWHLAKSGVDFEELREIDLDDLAWVEVNDGYVDADMGRTEETTSHRLLPGDGEYDVPGFVSAVRDTGYDGPWGVEVLNAELRRLPMRQLYEQTYEKTMAALTASR